MAQGIRELFSTKPGRVLAVTIGVVGVIVVLYSLKRQFGQSEASTSSSQRVFICSETGKSFNHELAEGEAVPVKSPYSGKATGYPAELCYWTKDGKVTETPYPVLLNAAVGKPGPTFCPDCRRLVVGHNPRPRPGQAPPPTQEEYNQSHQPATQRL